MPKTTGRGAARLPGSAGRCRARGHAQAEIVRRRWQSGGDQRDEQPRQARWRSGQQETIVPQHPAAIFHDESGGGPNPYPRKARPETTTARQRPAREIIRNCRACRASADRCPSSSRRRRGHRKRQFECVPLRNRSAGRAAMGASMARTMPSPMPVPPLSRRVVKKRSKTAPRLLGEMPSPSSLTRDARAWPCRAARHIERCAPWRTALSARVRKHDQRRFLRDPHRRIEGAAGADIERREGRAQACDRDRQRRGAAATGFSARANSRRRPARRSQPVGVGKDVVEKLAPLRSSMSGASTSSRSSSAAPWMEVSGDFSSCETWVAKVEISRSASSAARAMSRKLCDSSANSRVP